MLSLVCIAMVLSPGQNEEPLKPPTASPPLFAVAKVSQDGKTIAITREVTSGVQQYTVQVPVTRIVKDDDGESRPVTEMRTEVRTRKVPTARTVQETYVEYTPSTKTVIDTDGNEKEVTVMVPRTRTRTRVIPGAKAGKPQLHAIAKCQFRDLAGKPVSPEEVKRRLRNKAPIVLFQATEGLDPFYRAALNQKILLVTVPSKQRKSKTKTDGAIKGEK